MRRKISGIREDIHRRFIESLGDAVVKHTPLYERPLGVVLNKPFHVNLEVHLFPNTISSGRSNGEYKFCLSVPDQKTGEKASFPCKYGIPFLVSYTEEYDVFIIYDAYKHFTFYCSNNIQSRQEFILESMGNTLTTYEKKRTGEILIGVTSTNLLEGIKKRLLLN